MQSDFTSERDTGQPGTKNVKFDDNITVNIVTSVELENDPPGIVSSN